MFSLVLSFKMSVVGDKPLAASWSESGSVHLWDITHPLQAVNDPTLLKNYIENKESPRPLFTFKGWSWNDEVNIIAWLLIISIPCLGHSTEGFALDWSSTTPGVLATGDCKKHIHVWKPLEGGQWAVEQRPLVGHTSSVEDLQWSPNEPNVLASCSVDRRLVSGLCLWSVNLSVSDHSCVLHFQIR